MRWLVIAPTSMPRLGKRSEHLRLAIEAGKKARVTSEEVNELKFAVAGPSRQPEEVNDSSYSDFDVEEALKGDPEAMIEEITADWVASLTQDDLYSLSLLLLQVLTTYFQLLITAASKIIAKYVKRSHKPVEKWCVDFLKSGRELPEFLRRIYARMNCISKDENLMRAAKEYVRENAFKKGAANMTGRSF